MPKLQLGGMMNLRPISNNTNKTAFGGRLIMRNCYFEEIPKELVDAFKSSKPLQNIADKGYDVIGMFESKEFDTNENLYKLWIRLLKENSKLDKILDLFNLKSTETFTHHSHRMRTYIERLTNDFSAAERIFNKLKK